jgi:hypothetical protein
MKVKLYYVHLPDCACLGILSVQVAVDRHMHEWKRESIRASELSFYCSAVASDRVW